MIRCEHLTAGYGRQDILADISWRAAPGKLNVITGPNGSGKSTLLKSFMGQTRIRSGQIYLGDRPAGSWSAREKARLAAYVPQNRNDTNLTAGRMVLHGRFPHITYPRHYTKEDEDMVEQVLERMRIQDLKYRPVSELSGGEKQKVYLAMALVQEAPVLLLDEPAAWLDISWQLELMELLKELTLEGKTVAVVLHDLNCSLRYADRLLVMEKGRAAAEGTPEEILNKKILEQVFRLKVCSGTDHNKTTHYWFERAEAES